MFSKFFIYRPVFASVLSILILIGGTIALTVLPVARYPEIAPPMIAVSANYPGANAVTVGETVATPLEREINGVEGMLYMSSTSSNDGSMSLRVVFESGVDLDTANVLVQNRVALAEPSLPEEVRRLGVSVKKKSNEYTAILGLISPNGTVNSNELSNYTFLNIRDELSRVPGVSEVQVFGNEYSMRIWLNPQLMKVRGISASDVIAAIREQNVQVAAGSTGAPPAPEELAEQLTVTLKGRLSEVDEFADIVVRTGADGRVIRIKDIADIEQGQESYQLDSRINGSGAAAFAIYQLPGANAISVVDGVRATMDRLSSRFPEDVEYVVAYDSTQVIRASIREVVVTLFITLVLVVLTVYVFLQSSRATLIPAITIPVSLIGTFIVMLVLGYSLNILTLFGLVLVIGIVVDDAIVVVENTTRLIEEEGLAPREAAVKSMIEVTGPVIAITLVLLAVFVPTVFLGGIKGELFRQFAVTISVATVFSSVNALTLSPMLCGLLLARNKKEPLAPFRLFNAALDRATKVLGVGVRLAMRLAVLGVVAFAGIVVAAGLGFSSVPTGFVPQEDEGYFIVNVQLPDAASLHRTDEVLRRVEEQITTMSEVANVVTIKGYSLLSGSTSSNSGSLFVVLHGWSERETAEQHLNAVVQRASASFAQIQEAIVVPIVPPSLPGLGTSGGFAVEIQDRGGVGLGTLEHVVGGLIADANGQEALTRVTTTFRANVPQVFLNIDRDQVKTMGLSMDDVFGALSAYVGSVYVNDYTQYGKIYQVKVQADARYRIDAEALRRLEVRNRDGDMVPLGAIMTVEDVVGPQTVTHHNIYPSAKVIGGPAPGFSSGQAMDIVGDMAERKLPQTMGYAWTDISFQEQRAGGSTATFLLSVLLVYLVLAAQYESWTLPISVILAIPGALLGAVAGIYLYGMDNNVYTQIGVVLLIGLSAKTAILITEFAKVRRDEGASTFDAALDATRLRFRAVLMTAFSFILGVIPLMLASGAGAESRVVIGVTMFFGMLVATVLGVLAVPMLYFVVQSLVEKARPTKAKQAKAEPATN